jgi:curli biogenesis system outer membrane secretion channel CsgG
VQQKGFADMLITDLAANPRLVVGEREKLQALLKEITQRDHGATASYSVN